MLQHLIIRITNFNMNLFSNCFSFHWILIVHIQRKKACLLDMAFELSEWKTQLFHRHSGQQIAQSVHQAMCKSAKVHNHYRSKHFNPFDCMDIFVYSLNRVLHTFEDIVDPHMGCKYPIKK